MSPPSLFVGTAVGMYVKPWPSNRNGHALGPLSAGLTGRELLETLSREGHNMASPRRSVRCGLLLQYCSLPFGRWGTWIRHLVLRGWPRRFRTRKHRVMPRIGCRGWWERLARTRGCALGPAKLARRPGSMHRRHGCTARGGVCFWHRLSLSDFQEVHASNMFERALCGREASRVQVGTNTYALPRPLHPRTSDRNRRGQQGGLAAHRDACLSGQDAISLCALANRTANGTPKLQN